MKFIQNNFLSLVVIVLVLLLFFKQTPSTTPEIKIVRDTIWEHKDSTIYIKPQITSTIPVKYTERSIEYIPDTNYAALVKQYNKLVDLHISSNLYADSLKIDSIGYVHVKDTVSHNLIKGRSYTYSLQYPIINNYIPASPKNQIYYGGGISGNQYELVNSIYVGALLKTKKDRIFSTTVGLSPSGRVTYGLNSYWKIKIKK